MPLGVFVVRMTTTQSPSLATPAPTNLVSFRLPEYCDFVKFVRTRPESRFRTQAGITAASCVTVAFR